VIQEALAEFKRAVALDPSDRRAEKMVDMLANALSV
jgi:hypothetical protein